MFNSLQDIYIKFKFNLDDINKYKCIENYILELFNNNCIELDSVNENILLWNGFYYCFVKKDYVEMKKCYIKAVEMGNDSAMNNLGIYYEKIEKNYPEMKKHFLMAIELGNSNAMVNLGYYYKKNKNNYVKMKKYYMMGIELSNSNAMFNLGYYYGEVENNYPEMKKYYLMAIQLGNTKAMVCLGIYYEEIENNYPEMEKYYLMAIKMNDCVALEYLCEFYFDNVLILFDCLDNIDDKFKNTIIKNKLEELKQNKSVLDYLNKIEISKNDLNNIKTCNICFDENVLNLTLSCKHQICSKCYIQMNSRCYFNFCNDV